MVRSYDAGQHPDCSGLAGAVGSEEAKQFPLLHFEADMIDSQQLSIVLGEVLNFNGKRVLYGRISVVSLIINASQSASNLLILNIIPP